MYIDYNGNNGNGLRVKALMAKLQEVDAEMRFLSDLVNAIGSSNLGGNEEFGVVEADEVAFNDSFLQLVNAWFAFWGDGNGGSNREKASRFAR